MKTAWILLGAALLVGVGGGFITGRVMRGMPEGNEPGIQQEDVRQLPSVTEDRSQAARQLRSCAQLSQRGFEQVNRMPVLSDRVRAIMRLYETLESGDFKQELIRLDALPSIERTIASHLLFMRWGEVDPHGAMKHIQAAGDELRHWRITIFRGWAGKDPEGAAEYLKQMPGAKHKYLSSAGPPSFSADTTSIIASEWAKRDPHAALEYVKKEYRLPEMDDPKKREILSKVWVGNRMRDDAIANIVAEVGKTDPAKAVELIHSENNSELWAACNEIALHYGARDFAEAQAWVRTLPHDKQDAAMAAAINGLAMDRPDAAAKLR